jgi:hypothetical protein
VKWTYKISVCELDNCRIVEEIHGIYSAACCRQLVGQPICAKFRPWIVDKTSVKTGHKGTWKIVRKLMKFRDENNPWEWWEKWPIYCHEPCREVGGFRRHFDAIKIGGKRSENSEISKGIYIIRCEQIGQAIPEENSVEQKSQR